MKIVTSLELSGNARRRSRSTPTSSEESHCCHPLCRRTTRHADHRSEIQDLADALLEVGDQAIMGADMDVDWALNIDKPKNGFDVTLHSQSVEEARR